MFTERIRFILFCIWFSHIHASEYTGTSQDQTSPRVNTLSDDADDIQRQLDNEARDRFKSGRPKTIWVFHFPTHVSEANFPEHSTEHRARSLGDTFFNTLKLFSTIGDDTNLESTPIPSAPATIDDWDYKRQYNWHQKYPECGGRSQSPVNLPVGGLYKAKGGLLHFANYNVMPLSLTLMNDGKRVMMFGEWPKDQQPLVFGGAAHSRRYIFHSLTIHWPSEHTVGGLQYPMESQALHISAEYKTIDDALKASPSDPQAFLGIANLYKYSKSTHSGLADLVNHAINMGIHNSSIDIKPLEYFNPPFNEYACYYGSLPTPPCTESVLWFVRGRTMPVERELAEASYSVLGPNEIPRKYFFREPQPLNDRRVFLFT